MGKIQQLYGTFESDLLSDRELVDLQGAIHRAVSIQYSEQVESLYVNIIKLHSMAFFAHYANQFDGFWVQVQTIAKPQPEMLARVYTLIAVKTDDGWYAEFPWDKMRAFPDDPF